MEKTCLNCCYLSSCKKLKEIEDRDGKIYLSALNMAEDCSSYLDPRTYG